MKIRSLMCVLGLAIIFGGCTKLVDPTDDFIFIRDPYEPGLPSYTESGYNTFGAMYEKNYFVVNKHIVPMKIIYKNGNIELTLSGVKDYGNIDAFRSYADSTRLMSMVFVFPYEECNSYKDLLKLHNTQIDMKVAGCQIKLYEPNKAEKILDLQHGNLFIKRAQNLNVDGQRLAVILSGTFDCKFKNGERYEVIKNGRFDLSINDSQFTFVAP